MNAGSACAEQRRAGKELPDRKGVRAPAETIRALDFVLGIRSCRPTQSSCKLCPRQYQAGDMSSYKTTQAAMGDMAKSLARDPQLESILANRKEISAFKSN
jgi:hypothetical protein